MTAIEAESNALLDYLSRSKIQEVDTKGNVVRNSMAKVGTSSKEVELYKTLRDYYVYGIQYNQRGITFKAFGAEINTTKGLQKIQSVFSDKQLAFAVLPAAAQLIHGKIGSYIEATKGQIFNGEQWKEAEKFQLLNKKNIKMMHDLGHHFDIYTESELDRLVYEESREEHKYFDRAKYFGFRRADEAIDNTIMGAMLRNYGLDENGNHRNLKGLPEGTKSYWDLIDKKVLEETGKVKIEGMTKDSFISFKNAVQKGAIKVKGAVSADDISGYQANIYMKTAMQFKTWMPGIIKERVGKIRFDKDLDVVEYGRYRGVMDEYSYTGAANFKEYMKDVFLPNTAKLIWDIGTFGLSKSYSNIKADRRERAKAQYYRFLAKNPHLTDTVNFEDYVEARQAAIRASLTEFRAILAMSALVFGLGMKTDDEDEDSELYKEFGYPGRIIYKTLSRSAAEIGFTLNPMEAWRLAKNPIPVIGLLTDVFNTVGNTFDEGADLATGRKDKADKSPAGYYSRKWIVGFNQLFKIIDFIPYFEQDKESGLQ
jgi:hypothetical protein